MTPPVITKGVQPVAEKGEFVLDDIVDGKSEFKEIIGAHTRIEILGYTQAQRRAVIRLPDEARIIAYCTSCDRYELMSVKQLVRDTQASFVNGRYQEPPAVRAMIECHGCGFVLFFSYTNENVSRQRAGLIKENPQG